MSHATLCLLILHLWYSELVLLAAHYREGPMWVGVMRDTSSGTFSWHDGTSVIVPNAFWTGTTPATSYDHAVVADGFLDGRPVTEEHGYVCELNDPCTYAFVVSLNVLVKSLVM